MITVFFIISTRLLISYSPIHCIGRLIDSIRSNHSSIRRTKMKNQFPLLCRAFPRINSSFIHKNGSFLLAEYQKRYTITYVTNFLHSFSFRPFAPGDGSLSPVDRIPDRIHHIHHICRIPSQLPRQKTQNRAQLCYRASCHRRPSHSQHLHPH